MNLLLDTHVFIWWKSRDGKLSESTREVIATASRVQVSIASAWEASIKVGLGKLRIDVRFGDDLNGIELLAVGLSHVEAVRSLPHHHRDPFDRMLVAQAIVEGLTLVTHDRRLESYGVPILWT